MQRLFSESALSKASIIAASIGLKNKITLKWEAISMKHLISSRWKHIKTDKNSTSVSKKHQLERKILNAFQKMLKSLATVVLLIQVLGKAEARVAISPMEKPGTKSYLDNQTSRQRPLCLKDEFPSFFWFQVFRKIIGKMLMRGLCHQLISQYQTSGTVWEVRCLEVALTCAFCWKDLQTAQKIHLNNCANLEKLFCHVETRIKTSQVRSINVI